MKRLLLILMLILGAVTITSRPVADLCIYRRAKTTGEIMAFCTWLSTNKGRSRASLSGLYGWKD